MGEGRRSYASANSEIIRETSKDSSRLREVQDDSSMEARLLQREADALAFRVGREKQWVATHKRELRRIQGAFAS